MAYVNTILGTIDPEEMGITAVHEHIMWRLPGWEYDPNSWLDISQTFEKCYHELIDFRLQGGRTYVDCSGIGLGRDLDIYVKLASTTGLNIVASTGFGNATGIAPHFQNKDIDYFEELFFRELTRGMGNTLMKAGIIKVGTGKKEFTALEETQFRAAARAAKRVGSAIITDGVSFALKQLDVLRSEKFDLSRLIIGHLDSKDCLDVERDKQIARAGAYLGYDQVGIEGWLSAPYAMADEQRVDLFKAIVAAGLQDRILLSTSSNGWRLGRDEVMLHNVAHLSRYFLPKLKQAGISEKTINTVLVENPKRVLPIQ